MQDELPATHAVLRQIFVSSEALTKIFQCRSLYLRNKRETDEKHQVN
jgi:hypothetical protein